MKETMMLAIRVSLSGKNTGQARKNNQTGAAIVAIIVAVVIAAILGAGMLYLVTSSSISGAFIGNREKAFYMAQAGRNYATMVINNANVAGTPEIIEALNGQTFVLADGSKFYIRTDMNDVGDTFAESTGIVNEGTLLEARQKIAFTVESIKFSQEVFAVSSIQVSARSKIDSYDSRIGPYDPATFTKKAIVRTNAITAGAITVISGGYIYGEAICGAGGNPAVAIVAPAGSIDPGPRTAATTNVVYTPVVMPTGGETIVIPNATQPLGETGQTRIYRTGTINFTKSPSKTLTIKGNVTLKVETALGDGNVTLDNSKIEIENGGKLDFFIERTLTVRGSSTINPPPSPATAVRILGVDTTVLNFSAGIVYGGIYAPAADFLLAKESQIYGTVVADTISMSGSKSGCGIHVDKAFSGSGGGTGEGNVVY